MAEQMDNSTPKATGEPTPAVAGGQPAAAETPGQAPGPIPYERFAEVNTQLADLKKWRAEQEKAAAAAKKAADDAEAKRLAENNEFKTLAEQRAAKLAELEPLGERVKGLEAVIQGVYEAKLKDLPEAARKAVDALPGLSVEQKLAWLNENGALFQVAKPTAPNINATDISAPGGSTVAKTEDQVELWRRLGLNNAVRAAQGK